MSDVGDDLVEDCVCLGVVFAVLKLKNIFEALSILRDYLLARWLSMQSIRK